MRMLDEKGKEIELKGQKEKDVVKLKYKANQKQYQLNAEIDSILVNVQKENQQGKQNTRIEKLAKDGLTLIKKRQKLIKIAGEVMFSDI